MINIILITVAIQDYIPFDITARKVLAVLAIVSVLSLAIASSGTGSVPFIGGDQSSQDEIELSVEDLNATETQMTVGGNVSGVTDSVETYIEYRQEGEEEWQTANGDIVFEDGEISFNAESLEPDTQYEIKVVAENDATTVESDISTLRTKKEILAEEEVGLSIRSPSTVGFSTANLQGEVEEIPEGATYTATFEYRQQGQESWQETNEFDVSTIGIFAESVSGLADNATYEYRANLEVNNQSYQSDTTTFQTNVEPLITVSSQKPTDIGMNSATIPGELLDLGKFDEIDVSLETRQATSTGWVEQTRETYDEPSEVEYTVEELDPETFYEYRWVAQSDNETETTVTREFETLPEPTVEIEILEAQERLLDEILFGVEVTEYERYNESELTIEYRQENSSSWNQMDPITVQESGTVTSRASDLNPSTIYEFRATIDTGESVYGQATDSTSTATAQTLNPRAIDVVASQNVTELSSVSATFEADVTALERYDEAEVYFEYRPRSFEDDWLSTESIFVNGEETYSLEATELSPNTSYEYRAVAEADTGSARSEPRNFTTLQTRDISINTVSSSGISSQQATLTGEIIGFARYESAVVGFEYRKTESESGEWNYTEIGEFSSEDQFVGNIEDLTQGSQYEYRARADTGDGETYVSESSKTFTTDTIPTVTLRADEAKEIKQDSVRLTGTVVDLIEYENANVEFQYREVDSNEWNTATVGDITEEREFEKTVDDLNQGIDYSYRVRATFGDNEETISDNTQEFQTLEERSIDGSLVAEENPVDKGVRRLVVEPKVTELNRYSSAELTVFYRLSGTSGDFRRGESTTVSSQTSAELEINNLEPSQTYEYYVQFNPEGGDPIRRPNNTENIGVTLKQPSFDLFLYDETEEGTEIKQNELQMIGQVVEISRFDSGEVFLQYRKSDSESGEWLESRQLSVSEQGDFNVTLDNLDPGTQYDLRLRGVAEDENAEVEEITQPPVQVSTLPEPDLDIEISQVTGRSYNGFSILGYADLIRVTDAEVRYEVKDTAGSTIAQSGTIELNESQELDVVDLYGQNFEPDTQYTVEFKGTGTSENTDDSGGNPIVEAETYSADVSTTKKPRMEYEVDHNNITTLGTEASVPVDISTIENTGTVEMYIEYKNSTVGWDGASRTEGIEVNENPVSFELTVDELIPNGYQYDYRVVAENPVNDFIQKDPGNQDDDAYTFQTAPEQEIQVTVDKESTLYQPEPTLMNISADLEFVRIPSAEIIYEYKRDGVHSSWQQAGDPEYVTAPDEGTSKTVGRLQEVVASVDGSLESYDFRVTANANNQSYSDQDTIGIARSERVIINSQPVYGVSDDEATVVIELSELSGQDSVDLQLSYGSVSGIDFDDSELTENITKSVDEEGLYTIKIDELDAATLYGYQVKALSTTTGDRIESTDPEHTITQKRTFTTTVSNEPPVCSEEANYAGSGTDDDPYVVTTYAELYCISEQDLNASYEMQSFGEIEEDTSLDASPSGNHKFKTIGSSGEPFTGTFDANGRSINGLVTTDDSESEQALFGATSDATIRNLTIEDSRASGDENVGIVVGIAQGNTQLRNITVRDSEVNGNDNVGGVVGRIADQSFIDSARMVGNSQVEISEGDNLGGIVGYNQESIRNVTADVELDRELGRTANAHVGSIVGLNNGTVSDFYTTSESSVSFGAETAGGIVGENNGDIQDGLMYNFTFSETFDSQIGIPGQSSEISNVAIQGSSLPTDYEIWNDEGYSQNTNIDIIEQDRNLRDSSAEAYADLSYGVGGNWITQENAEPELAIFNPTEENVNRTIAGVNCEEVNYDGVGTQDDPYLIDNDEQLQCVFYNTDSHYVLNSSITEFDSIDDIADRGFKPIGTSLVPFEGTMLFNNNSIENLHIDRGDENNVGLFGVLDDGGSIQNGSLKSANITGTNSTSVLVGRSKVGNISHVDVENSVVRIEQTANIRLKSEFAGGVAGSVVETEIDNTTAEGIDINPINKNVGGFAGIVEDDGRIENSTTRDIDISGSGLQINNTGGFAGRINNSQLYNNSASGVTISSGKDNTGGFAGITSQSILANVSTSTVTLSDDRSSNVGGLIGKATNESEIIGFGLGSNETVFDDRENTVDDINVVGTNNIGGSIGFVDNSSDVDNIKYNNIGISDVSGRNIGGVIGQIDNSQLENAKNDPRTIGMNQMTADNIGGVIGKADDSDIHAVKAQGGIEGDVKNIGGVVGYIQSSNLDQAVSNMDITVKEGQYNIEHVGGIIGISDSTTVTNTYSRGDISASEAGSGIVGRLSSDTSVYDSYTRVSAENPIYNDGDGDDATVKSTYWNEEELSLEGGSVGKPVEQVAFMEDQYSQVYLNGFDYQTVWVTRQDESPGLRIFNPQEGNEEQLLADGSINCDDHAYSGGNGTASDPYQISDPKDLQCVFFDLNKNFEVVNDLDLENKYGTNGFRPLGVSTNAYSGTFEGNNHTISNLNIERSGSEQGLFGTVGSELRSSDTASISNVHLRDATVEVDNTAVSKGEYVGIFAGETRDGMTISESSADGSLTVYNMDYVGGFVGNMNNGSVIERSYTTSDIEISNVSNAGGFVGYMKDGNTDDEGRDRVKEVYNKGALQISGGTVDNVGGIFGYTNADVVDAYSTSVISQSSGDLSNAGGIGGQMTGGSKVKNVYSVGGVDHVGNVKPNVAQISNQEDSVENMYWSDDATKTNASLVGYSIRDEYINGTEARTALNGFNFQDIWVVRDGNNPTLRNIHSHYSQPDLTIGQVNCADVSYSGSGTEPDPLIVDSPEKLQCIFYNQNSNYEIQNIDMSVTETWNGGDGFKPIGTESNPFNGTVVNFGSENTVSNLHINTPDDDFVGLFGRMGGSGSINNLTVSNADLVGNSYVGGLSGQSINRTSFNSSNVDTVDITGENYLGGAIGESTSSDSINNLYVKGIDIEGSEHIGGFTGSNGNMNMTNVSVYQGSINASGNYVGGFIGEINSRSTINTYRAELDNVSGHNYVGGGVGHNDGGSLSLGAVEVDNVYGNKSVGGLIGDHNKGSQGSSYMVGSVEGNRDVGGLVGTVNSTARKLYTSSSVGSGTNKHPSFGRIRSAQTELIYHNADAASSATTGSSNRLYTNELYGASAQAYLANFDFEDDWVTRQDTHPTIQEFSDRNSNYLQFGPVDCSAVSHVGSENGDNPSEPKQITSLEGLQCASLDVNSSYEVTVDTIDASATDSWNDDRGFIPIGTRTNGFSGTFDGNNVTIENLHVDQPNNDSVGLFGQVYEQFGRPTDSVKNITLTNPNVTGENNVGLLAGSVTSGDVSDIHVHNGTIEGKSNIGGFVGSLGEGSITESEVLIDSYTVETNVTRSNIGGFVGKHTGGEIDQSKVRSQDSIGSYSDLTNVSGFAGYSSGESISRSYADVDVRLLDSNNVGGFIGRGSGTEVTNTFVLGDVSIIGNTNSSGFIGGGNIDGTNTHWSSKFQQNTTYLEPSTTGSPIPTQDMKDARAKANFGFDFENIWVTRNGDVPELRTFTDKNTNTLDIYVGDCSTISYNGGSGTSSDPYQIADFQQFQCATLENDNYFELTSDIYAGSYSTSTNYLAFGSGSRPFTRIFDGNGHTISGISSQNQGSNAGVFGYIDNANVVDVDIENTNIDSAAYKGGVFAGTIDDSVVQSVNVSNSGVTGHRSLGGFAGVVRGSSSITNTEVSSTTIDSTEVEYNGPAGKENIGGYVGKHIDGNIERSIANAQINTLGDHTGGFVGKMYYTSNHKPRISESTVRGSITTEAEFMDSIAGFAGTGGNIDNSYVSSSTTIYADGDISNIAGFVGTHQEYDNYDHDAIRPTIDDSWTAANIDDSSSPQITPYGFYGEDVEAYDVIENTYWNGDTTDATNRDDEAQKLTTTEMTGSSATSQMNLNTFTWSGTGSYPELDWIVERNN